MIAPQRKYFTVLSGNVADNVGRALGQSKSSPPLPPSLTLHRPRKSSDTEFGA